MPGFHSPSLDAETSKGGRDMQKNCENPVKCHFFEDFKGNSEVVKEGWIRHFCESKEKSEKGERKKVGRQTGKPPLDNMAPTGKML
jgi:hypothetical protein